MPRESRRYYEYSIIGASGKVRKNKIYELTEKEAANCGLIGTASGQDFPHCLYLAARYGGKDFHERVYGYRRAMSSAPKNCALSISFYEEPRK
ncbi:MAG: hypothetical protein A2745_02495 [Candidatus Harrisonbacteria bacterium RIFCSPHIGHO2_01_FULL_44_13]|uniref:Uncharacterized protein n=1 Tax=Candidatus Harrisonbacteria bacterium RIFCSPLOWO2_01_FULL_44_18 TaxID=1798407 RepID=A0A1G1ZN35_9BACT|nr:MAG: hypothetical protein A2745_02495 [Candidatus Harrisonbacteria bacterium RIFCSPHIGHO2_01_FULL_44_13]OGY65829.1 MAG: hypothetical protein A3A16_02050 [Candidatus Harrisonbacteria bacterium RIFCSPLOWO2_01_FULL_44_18]